MRDLHELPRIRDSWSYLYVEHCRVDQEHKAIVIEDARGRVPVPCATLALLMLGPGTTVTHAAIRTLSDNGCLAAWCGEQGIRYYAQGMGETRSAANLLRQAKLWADPQLHLQVVYRLYQARFSEPFEPGLTLQQIRGHEGIRVRGAYQQASQTYGVKWEKRNYDRREWGSADPLNRALSAANSCLYGMCHAAIVSAGFSPALGFIHTGKMLSFVYDIADLYKAEIAVPTAFRQVAQGGTDLEGRVRRACRDAFHQNQLLSKIVPAIKEILALPSDEEDLPHFDVDGFAPGALWDPEANVDGGVNYADEEGWTDGRNDPRTSPSQPQR